MSLNQIWNVGFILGFVLFGWWDTLHDRDSEFVVIFGAMCLLLLVPEPSASWDLLALSAVYVKILQKTGRFTKKKKKPCQGAADRTNSLLMTNTGEWPDILSKMKTKNTECGNNCGQKGISECTTRWTLRHMCFSIRGLAGFHSMQRRARHQCYRACD